MRSSPHYHEITRARGPEIPPAAAAVHFDDVDGLMEPPGGFVQVALADEREGKVAQHDGLGLGVVAVRRGGCFEQSLRAPRVFEEQVDVVAGPVFRGPAVDLLPDAVQVISLAQRRDSRQELSSASGDSRTHHDREVVHGCDARISHAPGSQNGRSRSETRNGCRFSSGPSYSQKRCP